MELGTFYGTSFFSFCQAVEDGQLPTQCYAVDTWRGDPHSGHYDNFGEHVYQAVQTVNTRQFSQIGTLLRSDFDQAIHSFPDDSIDLLHIDGYHTYEAVYHDYTTWYPKVCAHGIVLFHDIAVRASDFGVYQLWEELTRKAELPYLEFTHCNGLGVLFPKGCPELFHAVLDQRDILRIYYQQPS